MTIRPAILPDFVTPADFADHFGVGERWVREKAAELGACCIIGKKMVHLPHHVEMILEAVQPCHLKSTSAVKSGTTEAPSPSGDYAAARAQLTKKSPKGSRRKSKQTSGEVISMDRGRM